MNLDLDFFQVSKLSEDQKKIFTRNGTLFFPEFKYTHSAQMHTRVKLLEGMQMKTILKLMGGYNQIFVGGYISLIPPGFGIPDLGALPSRARASNGDCQNSN